MRAFKMDGEDEYSLTWTAELNRQDDELVQGGNQVLNNLRAGHHHAIQNNDENINADISSKQHASRNH